MGKTFEWVSWGILEFGKYYLITHGILGFDLTKRKIRLLIPILYLLVGGILAYCIRDSLYFEMFFGLSIVCSFFEASIEKKIQCFLMEYFLITSLDISCYALTVNLLVRENFLDTTTVYFLRGAETISIILVIIVCMFLKNKKKAINRGIQGLKKSSFFLLLVMFIVTATFVSIAFGAEIDESTITLQNLFFLLSVLVAIGVIVLTFMLFYYIYVRGRLEKMNELNLQCLENQKKFYATLIQKDEGLRQFRHDVSKHLSVIAAMCEQKDSEKIQKYIGELQISFSQLRMNYTGNEIVDYFLNDAIAELRETGKKVSFNIVGKFPKEIKLSDNELCVLLGNAIENAKEALLHCEGKLELQMTIENYNDKLYIKICNTFAGKKNISMQTNKRDKELHGYGLGNMKQVVEKYGGKIEWKYLDNMFELSLEI